MNRPTLWILMAAAIGPACNTDEPPQPKSVDGAYVYACSNDFRFTVRIAEDSAEVDMGQLAVVLPRDSAASDFRYSDGRFSFSTTGDEAVLETPAGAFEGCEGERARDNWHAAHLRGAVFRGVGQEPGWTVEIIPNAWIGYVGDYGRTRIFMPIPAPVAGDGTTTYHSATESHELKLVIRDATCTDTMSGEQFDKAVELEVDGTSLHGCGRFVDS